MIFYEIKCHVNTSLGLVGGMHPLHPPCVRAWWLVPLCHRTHFFHCEKQKKIFFETQENYFFHWGRKEKKLLHKNV